MSDTTQKKPSRAVPAVFGGVVQITPRLSPLRQVALAVRAFASITCGSTVVVVVVAYLPKADRVWMCVKCVSSQGMMEVEQRCPPPGWLHPLASGVALVLMLSWETRMRAELRFSPNHHHYHQHHHPLRACSYTVECRQSERENRSPPPTTTRSPHTYQPCLPSHAAPIVPLSHTTTLRPPGHDTEGHRRRLRRSLKTGHCSTFRSSLA